ncbi:hypothetical protein GQ600_7120 [Phytophthora cactorum]|nr:hypothetical protein GQ600_7120 [Phytophthora cactorum]
MTDGHAELLTCVLQLAKCSDKLRATDAMLGKCVTRMQRDLPASGMPRLTSKLAVVPANPAREAQTPEEKFQEFDQGTEFRELVKSRNTDIQQEYARMLKELDDQVESLDQEIAKEREIKAERAKRQREEALERKATKKQHLEAETTQLKEQLEESQQEVENQESENSPDDDQSVTNGADLRRNEIVLLKEAQEAIAEKIDKQSLKTQYEEEKQEVLEETLILVEDLTPQINSNGTRLHSLLRTLAPSPGIGTLMTRLFQQLCGESRAPSSPELPPTPRKTVDLKAFLNSCPSFEEGNRAIDELKKLQLIHCYESSGIIALAD